MRKNLYASKIRNKVLSTSLRIDELITVMLADLLGIDSKSSLTLGNKGSALTFKSKVELLIDIGALDRVSKSKFIKFMEIRNQFAHNISAESFSTCFESIDGLVAFLKKNYPNAKGDKKTEESFFEKLFEELSSNVISLALGMNKIASDKKKKHLTSLYKTEAFDVLVFSVESMAKVYLTMSAVDSPEYILAKRMEHLVEAAKNSLYESALEKAVLDDDSEP